MSHAMGDPNCRCSMCSKRDDERFLQEFIGKGERAITEELLDRLDAEHDKLVQPREFDRELRRLARIGLRVEAEALTDTQIRSIAITSSDLFAHNQEQAAATLGAVMKPDALRNQITGFIHGFREGYVFRHKRKE